MGTKMGPSYANCFVGYTEHQFFIQYNGAKPELYCRYIDDCVGATSSTREELNQFITISIPYSQLLRLRRLCSEDSNFSLKSEEMCHFFDKRGYPASVVQAGHHRAQLNVANKRTCFASCACAFKSSGLITRLECTSD